MKIYDLEKNNVKTDLEIEDFSKGGKWLLDKTISEKNQGVIIKADLKWEDNVRSAAAKAIRVLRMLKNEICEQRQRNLEEIVCFLS